MDKKTDKKAESYCSKCGSRMALRSGSCNEWWADDEPYMPGEVEESILGELILCDVYLNGLFCENEKCSECEIISVSNGDEEIYREVINKTVDNNKGE